MSLNAKNRLNYKSSLVYSLPISYNSLSKSQRREVRQQYIQKQNHKCFCCGESLYKNPPRRITKHSINWKLFPYGFLNHTIHLQHNHKSGLTEGAVHAYCNAYLWQYKGR